MQQTQIDQISDAFLNAYKEFFGMEVEYIPIKDENITQNKYEKMYGETSELTYDEENKVIFHGSINFNPEEKEITMLGFDPKQTGGIITCVRKELVDKGIISEERNINFADRIRITDRFNQKKNFIITNKDLTVQFSDNFIFSKIGIVEEDDFNV